MVLGVTLVFWYAAEMSCSVPLVFTSNSPWRQDNHYRSEATCEYQLNKDYTTSELKINVTTELPTYYIELFSQMRLLQTIINSNTYIIDNVYQVGPGIYQAKFQFDHHTNDPLSGYCTSNAGYQAQIDQYTTPILYTSVSDNSITTNNMMYTSGSENSITKNNLYCGQEDLVCVCRKVVNSTTYENTKAINLIEDLRIDKKKTALARSKKISATDTRTSVKAIGTLGVLIITFSVGMIMLSDANTLINSAKSLRFIQNYRKYRLRGISKQNH
ncbi:Hypothetical predicted protein [Mytilus galloprovincialis]|uniref:CUB domain-containing protein n=1 Tax=Mytilus galloprovincialis TaxID=29158 RepID=A0A8B6H0E0_MYTGA|nr:Hypothetical predicted protein [Mytilus galloprovincialis]